MCAKKTSGNIERMGVSRGNAPRSNQAQNQQINRIVKDLGLSKSQRKLLHQEINKQGYGYQEILKIAKDLFKK